MKLKSKSFLLVVSIIAIFSLTGCWAFQQPEEPQMVDETLIVAHTQAAETIIAELTLNAPTETFTSVPIEETDTQVPTETSISTPTLTSTFTAIPTQTSIPTDTPIPSITPLQTLLPDESFSMIFEDDFKQNTGWVEQSGENFDMHYAKGGYYMSNGVKNDTIWSIRSPWFGDVRVESEAQWLSGPRDGYSAVICRFQNGSNYYLFAVGYDGVYGIAKKKAGQLAFFQEGVDKSGIIHTDGTMNRIRGDCVGNVLTLYVNGEKMLQVKDSDFPSGKVGIAIGNRSVAGLEVVFKYFSIFTTK